MNGVKINLEHGPLADPQSKRLPMSPLKLMVVTVALLVLVAGCTANKMHRPVSVQDNPDYTLAFIEFDDQGEMWDTSQLSRALEVIGQANANEAGSVVVTFIHGWQHNASEKDELKESGNVYGFKQFLETIAQTKRLEERMKGAKLIGIYIGWRGKSGSIPGLNLGTFYNRSGAARRISGTSSTEVIYRIMSTTKKNPNSRLVLMGHSFGGQILERSVTQAMVGELLRGDKELDRGLPADLVVLINPAAKSIEAKQFVEVLDRSHIEVYRTRADGTRTKVPLMVSITSSADLATRWAFPAGTWVSSIGKNFHKYRPDACLEFPRQRFFYTRTPGHNKALVSHEVSAEPLPADQGAANIRDIGKGLAETEFDPVAEETVFSFNGDKNRFTVRPLGQAVNDTPYWIMQVPRQLIPGHSGFFTEDTLRLIASIIDISGAVEADARTELVREAGVRPNNLEIMPDGRVIVSDASRRLYEVNVTDSEPVLYGCVPALSDPTTNIGLGLEGQMGFGARSRPTGKSTRKGTNEYETVFAPITLTAAGLQPGKLIKLDSDEQFVAAAFDMENRRVFLSGVDRKVIYMADLNEKKPAPELWLVVEDEGVISDLHYNNTTGALYAAGGKDGVLYRLTEHGEGPVPTLVARSLGWPVGMAVDEARRRIYVGDAQGKQIWRIDCPQEDRCDEPKAMAHEDIFSSPSELDVADDGTLWVADRQGQIIVALSPDGEILQKITELPRE
jgi:hypothetical protein